MSRYKKQDDDDDNKWMKKNLYCINGDVVGVGVGVDVVADAKKIFY